MRSQFYVEGTERASKVRELFDTIARRYDLINDLQSFGLHRYWKNRMIHALAPRPGDKALDICCGTGDVSLALARRGADVCGLDFSAPMLEVAKRRKSDRPIRWVLGDAQNLPFPDESFDIVSIAYGLRNLADLATGLKQMRRVLKKNGRLAILDFGKPRSPRWRRIYFGYLRLAVPCFGAVFFNNADTHSYILASLESFPSQDEQAQFLEKERFSPVECKHLLGGVMGLVTAKKPATNPTP